MDDTKQVLSCRYGFTLTELMIVLSVVVCAAAIATPTFSRIKPSIRLKAAATDLHSNMQEMRVHAIRTHQPTAIIFHSTKNKYTVCSLYNETSSSCDNVSCVVDLDDYRSGIVFGKGGAKSSQGVDGATIPNDYVCFSSPDDTAVFDNTGLGNSGQVYLENENKDLAYAITKLSSGMVRNLQWRGDSEWQ